MSAQDWYARRLGQARQGQQPPPQQARPGMLPGQRPVPPTPQQYQQPQYAQPVTQFPQMPGNQQMYEQQAHGQPPQQQNQQYPQQVVQFAGHQYAGVENYRGGVAQQMNPNPCPQCGGNQYFEHIKTKGRGPEPAGHCYNCGYNELFDQGDQAVWGSGQPVVASNAPPQQAAIQVNSSPWQNGMAPA